eukprot:TRINITY_DN7015_c0_g1_i2.p2 TRINITY_DN7015_c0_g1~~TRINITY_DN7015_c0_g1_i2.p2  ORF type:complete len:264 (+),score=-9.37 TRINITY_DN7015_c0_g1_i2:188-979(+)
MCIRDRYQRRVHGKLKYGLLKPQTTQSTSMVNDSLVPIQMPPALLLTNTHDNTTKSYRRYRIKCLTRMPANRSGAHPTKSDTCPSLASTTCNRQKSRSTTSAERINQTRFEGAWHIRKLWVALVTTYGKPLLDRFQKPAFVQPFQAALLPGIPFFALIPIVTVSAFRKFQQFGRHVMRLERLMEHATVRHRHDRIRPGMGQEGGGRLIGDLFFVGKKFNQLRRGGWSEQIVTCATMRILTQRDHRVNKHHEIRPATQPFNWIH